ncbi:hypothetical protein DUI87_05436 [Hirundo rustica rustica]|uniref:Vitellogenin domain-containing protein n=1 Tax=Hirundo rustica rustica TaxID=333673 RepID=A0A3M0KYJ6_HIRRU|nr:hypothetical protein DUI87_05436 [Hirundo rustica rustica]
MGLRAQGGEGSSEGLSYGASCFAECTGHSASYFPKRARYSYRYSAVTNTFPQGNIYKSSGISLESTVIIEVLGNCQMVLKVQDAQIKKSFASREESLKEMDSLRKILEQHPLHFSFHDGKVLKLCPVRGEQTWALNIKRGILSVLQTAQEFPAGAIVEEVDVLGICPTRYRRKGPILVKTKDLNLCSHHSSGLTSVQSVVLPHVSPEQQILSSQLECVQSIKDGVLEEARCTESDRTTLFPQQGSGAETQTQSALKLLQVETETLYNKGDSEDLYVTNILYEREVTKREVTGAEVNELVWKLCLAHSASYETADLFMTLVFELRHLSLEALRTLWQRSSFKCRDNWQPLIDALPSCATEACVVLMKDLIASGEVEEDKVDYFFWSFAFIPNPTSGMIESLALQLVLKAIGNAGLAAAPLAPALSWCAALRSQPTEIRLAAVQAFRRIPCSARNAILVQLYQATSEDVEIRIAAYYLAMKCPHEELFKQVQKTLLKETSSQVGSFVWSHLSQLLETDDPLKEHLRDSIPDEILIRDFDWEIWKYSSYSDVTFHSALFLRVVGVRLENAETLIEKGFGPKSSTFSDYFFGNTNEGNQKSETPVETAEKVKQSNPPLKRYSPTDHLVSKSGKPKLRKTNQNCLGRKYSEMNELVKKFTERTVRKEAPKCELSMKIFGNELSFLDCEDLRKQMKHYSLNLAELAVKLLKLSVRMGIVGTLGQAGLKWLTGMRTSTSLDGGIQVKKGKELKVFLNTPEESMEIINFSSKLYLRMVDETEDIDVFQDHAETRSCTREEVSEIIGWQLCSEMSYPDPASGLVFPLPGPLRVAVTLTKQDRGLQQYVVEAAYNYIAQENSWIPSEAVFHFFIGTPESDLKRDVGVDLSFSIPQKKFRIQFIQPMKKIEIDGRIEFSKNSQIGLLELIVDDRDVYYIKGMADLQMLSGEQRYMTQLEVKLIKQSSPIILSGNITKQLGKKIAFSLSLNNLLKDAAFLSGEARTPCHECGTQQKVQVETGARGLYRLELGHEFHCVQAPTYSHQMEVNYGKHWDEINNKKKLLISQVFKNSSSSSVVSYFMEFTMQILEKQVNYRTQLQHLHTSQVYLQSSTNFEVQYNDHVPFVAGLQWKDTSRNGLKKWEGGFNMDTPWLYLYTAHKLHQPQHSAYLLTSELTAGKALSIKDLVLELFYNDQGNEKEGKVHIYTPATTYLQLEFPQAMGLSGELFSRQTKLEHFDCGVSVKVIINKNVSSQAQAALKSYGGNNVNGSLHLHSNGREMLMLEVDVNNENRRKVRIVELRAFLHQTVLTNPESVQFQLMGKIFPSRLLFSSDLKLNENRLHMDFMGAREQKVGFVLSLNGRVQHTFTGLKAIPHLLSLDGLLKCKNNIHDGNINVMVNKRLYGLHIRNRNVFGNATVHNITVAIIQNGSQAIPGEARLTGHLELSNEKKRGLASFQVDEKALSVDFFNIMDHGHSKVSGTFTHNVDFLKNAGLPLDGILTAMCERGSGNHTIAIALQSGSDRIAAVFEGHRLATEPPTSQLSVSLKHNISKIKKQGIPFVLEAAGYYENFSRKIAAGITTTVETEQFKIEIEKKTTGTAMEISLSLHHDVGELMDIVPHTPARVSLNGSISTNNFTVILFGHVYFHDIFAWLQLYATTNTHPRLEINFQHSLPSLHSLGIARENQLKVSAMRSDKYKGIIGIVLGPCTLEADGEVSLESNETGWVLAFRNKCVSLERMGLPQAAVLGGSFRQNVCNMGLLMNLQCDGRAVDVQMDTSCQQGYTLQGMLRHSLPWLSQLGLPFENSVLFSAATDSTTEGIFLLQAGRCRLRARGDLRVQSKADWTLETETDCQLLQDLSFPTQSRLTGSIQKDKCQAELLSVLETEGKSAHLEVRAECKPKMALEIHFRHDLPQLKEIPGENELSITARKHFKYLIGVGMKLGTCELQMSGDFDPEKNLQWKMFIENKCQTIQDFGAPMKIDGSGYLLMDKMNLDSQTLITVDENKFRGLLILKVTRERQELDAVLTHNIQGAADIGIPMRMLVDVISEKTSDSYKGFINFCVNNKQITEELNFVQKLDVVSLNYKLTHNIETLKTLQIKDRTELQIDAVFQGRNTTQERYVHIAAGETSITYTINSYSVGHRVDVFCQSVHSSEELQASGYPKAINLIFSLQKSEKKAKTVCEIQYDEKDITVTVDVGRDFELFGIFVFMAEVKHSISLLHHLGLPFFFKMTIQEVMTENETEGALRLTYEQNKNFSFSISRKKDQQGEELNIKALQTHPFFLQYFPCAAELSSEVNYDMSEAKGKLFLRMEKRDFNVSAKLTLTGSSYTNAIEVAQTMAQLKTFPRQLVFVTIYQKSNRTHLLRHIALWDGKEIKLTGTYTGLFPKLHGGHGIQVELLHPLSIPFPRHAWVNLYVKHSARSHRDDLTVVWNEKDKLQVSGNAGQPAHLGLGLEDKSKMDSTAWSGCVTLSAGQLQRILSMEHLQACGSLEQRPTLFNEYLDLNWDDKKFKHNFTYERNQLLYPDKFQLEAVLENIFLTPCTKQKILGKIETNYCSCLDYYTSFEFCDLPNVVLSGKHQLNKDDIILQSEGRFHLAEHGRDEGLIGISIKNQSTADVKNYSLEIELRAFEDIWLGLTGTAASSSVQSQILVEGIIDQKEKVKVAASKGKECFQYYMGHLQGDLEEGIEVSACSDGQQMAAINTYLSINGKRQENVGQVTLAAANGSLSFLAHGCGDPFLKVESTLNEIGSLLKATLIEKIKKFDGYLWRFKRSVQHVGFLSEAAGWASMASQRAAGFLHSGGTAVAQVWKQSAIGHMLRSRIPLYLEKIQDVVQQMQNELQKPLATLKDAYYDVTLKPLDEVWKEKTEEHMKKIQTFLPKIVKDVWLMEPIQVALKVVKGGLDMATQQVLRWAEAAFSRAVSKIRKPLLNLYSFSPRNCSVAGKLPVLPKAGLSLQLANVTTYLIGEKLMRPLQDLYNLNILAEFYRFKRRMMESPFEYHAMLVGTKHLVTFDGKMYDLASKCSVLLAKDFTHSAFTVILNEETRNSRSLYVEMNQTAITIYPRLKISKMYNFSFMEENCQVLDQSFENSTMNSRQGANKIEVSDQQGVSISCDFQYDLCTVTLAGWHHGVSAGLFGTNDNEAGNEWMVPNGSFTENVKEFTQSWQVEPEPFYTMCTQDTCDSPPLGAACRLAAAFVHLCNRNFVPVEIPPQWSLDFKIALPFPTQRLECSCSFVKGVVTQNSPMFRTKKQKKPNFQFF